MKENKKVTQPFQVSSYRRQGKENPRNPARSSFAKQVVFGWEIRVEIQERNVNGRCALF